MWGIQCGMIHVSSDTIDAQLHSLVPELDSDSRSYVAHMVAEEAASTVEELLELIAPFIEEYTSNTRSVCEALFKTSEGAAPAAREKNIALIGSATLGELMQVSSTEPFEAAKLGSYSVQEVDNSTIARRRAKKREKATGLKQSGSGLSNADAKTFYQTKFRKRIFNALKEGLKVTDQAVGG